MQVINLATVVINATAGGDPLLDSVTAAKLTTMGMTAFVVNPTVDIVIVDNQGLSPQDPGITGTVANSPFICPANVSTVLDHRSGSLRAISTGAAATVKRGARCAP